jgi:GT2 family glycosyltransferase
VLVREQGADDAEHDALRALAAGSGGIVEVERGPNLGFCGGHNRLLGRATGQVVLLLNADARLDPGSLEAAVAAFEDPGVGAVQPLVLLDRHGPPTVDATGLEPSRSRRVVARDHGRPWAGQRPAGEVWGVDGAVALYRAVALADASSVTGEVFPSSYFAYKEDVELAWRLRRLGWSARFEPAARAWHRRGTREPDVTDLATRWRARRDRDRSAHVNGFANLRLTQVRHERIRLLARDVGPWLTREVGAWAALAMRPRDLGAAAGRIARGLPEATRARRAMTRRTRVLDDTRWFGNRWFSQPPQLGCETRHR